MATDVDNAPRIYRYVVRYDDGVAPNPHDGVCSLAICKPRIRASARVGDWVVGLQSRRSDEVVYAMRVDERLTFAEYRRDPRYRGRRDNIYRPDRTGKMVQVPNRSHGPADAAKDLRGRNVLVSRHFWYFGADSVALPPELLHLVHRTQGHSVYVRRRAGDLAKLKEFLAAWRRGRHDSAARVAARRDKADCSASCATDRRAASPIAKRNRASRTCSEEDPALPRRLVLSRKGFDSGYGGIPSPILPDGRLVPLPIPRHDDAQCMADAWRDPDELGALLADLGGGRHSLATRVHVDPALECFRQPKPRDWRPAFGQMRAAQRHLAGRDVGVGDVFLFFGWFREVENRAGRWRYVPKAPQLHVLFGWLEVGEVLPIGTERDACIERHPWLSTHPHATPAKRYAHAANTLYVARARSVLVPGHPGGGRFRQFAEPLQLTAPGCNRSTWSLPRWFTAARGRTPLTYHADRDRWRANGELCRLTAVAKGQEFVLDLAGRPEALPWLRELIVTHGAQRARHAGGFHVRATR